jgi:transcriptional regulator with XRE-family HTH domain
MAPDPRAIAKARVVIAAALRKKRELAGMSQAQLAEALGVSRDKVARWERGEGEMWTGGPSGTIDFELTRRVAGVLNARLGEHVKVAAILPRNQYPSAPVDPVLRRQWVNERNRWIREMGT